MLGNILKENLKTQCPHPPGRN